LLRQQLVSGPQLRLYSQDVRGTFSRQAARRRTLKETAMAPAEGTAFSLGSYRYRYSQLTVNSDYIRDHIFRGPPLVLKAFQKVVISFFLARTGTWIKIKKAARHPGRGRGSYFL
jgi:hypothetical protein